ncbi:hypothetical protein GUITHDRAFT_122729 [Guillardia theta CCMP2712]|uniref:Uncharacterized protein n=1 Tax=Guillardia theta (strain CCMP2712) TaxID=905079 RepID=L1I497_GUITC|nr:hypothetical protein GUITHDRAFT_122729 [Guillardia theta CCMP2712]EKX31066.1 hypothetical protein GUITHDRAFT_122729 [Guillardia theta CCMP2712]|eukprot:XP_005818046.1 hypothetical protein GUITHDRAFT_122729 [Guillardia theta CCMP2712]
MNPLIVKFNRINLENSCLSDVKDIIFDRYMEVSKPEIEEFNNANLRARIAALGHLLKSAIDCLPARPAQIIILYGDALHVMMCLSTSTRLKPQYVAMDA